MENKNYNDTANEQNRQKYEKYTERTSKLSPLFKDAKDFMMTDAMVENELREIIKRDKIEISNEDLNSLLRVGLGENGAHFLMTLNGIYIDTGDKVLFQPMTKTIMDGQEKDGDVWLSDEEIDGFRKRFPFDQLKRAVDEAFLEAKYTVMDEMLVDESKGNE